MSEVKDILSKYKTIAMIGVSKDPTKPSTIVMKYMQKYGFKVIPVNPRAKGEKILGEEVFEKITDIKEPVEIVDVFRPSKEAYGIAEDTVKIGAKVLWLQLGIRDENAKRGIKGITTVIGKTVEPAASKRYTPPVAKAALTKAAKKLPKVIITNV